MAAKLCFSGKMGAVQKASSCHLPTARWEERWEERADGFERRGCGKDAKMVAPSVQLWFCSWVTQK